MDKNRLKSAYQELFAPSLKKATDLVVDRAEGPYLYGIDGDRYLDFVQGIAVNALGHGHPALVEAALGQIRRLGHVSFNLVTYPQALELAEELKRHAPGGLEAFFLANTGAEAVDGALKLARYVTGRTSIVAFRGSFHGRTMGAASVTSSNVSFRRHYAPFMPQVYFAPYPYCLRCSFGRKPDDCGLECLEYLKQDLNYIIPGEDVSAVLFEPVMGEGGYVVPPGPYVEALGRLARDLGALLIFDEVQTGLGRTGRLFASQHFDVQPDVMCLGKAVGGGFPLAVIASRREIMEKWPPGAHGTTFGGHPVACATGLALLKIVSRPDFLAAVREKGEYFRARLLKFKADYPAVADVRGLGLMNALELAKADGSPDPDLAGRITNRLREKKILLLTCGVKGNVIRFIPPLNVEQRLLDEVIEALAEALAVLTKA
ncbi:MAG: aminotransferase class III-fold pyridoxal phosphate-dependent enzyme [Thermodesulfobacteriota bacterium]